MRNNVVQKKYHEIAKLSREHQTEITLIKKNMRKNQEPREKMKVAKTNKNIKKYRNTQIPTHANKVIEFQLLTVQIPLAMCNDPQDSSEYLLRYLNAVSAPTNTDAATSLEPAPF